MIQLQLKLNSNSVAVNPTQVTHVSDAKDQGCVIHFISGHSVHVKNEYLTVVALLTAQ